MLTLAEQRLAALLDDVAAPEPAPGGGSSAALVCALAAALVEMAARLARAPGGDAAVAPDRARALRERAVELAERELHSYAPVLEAQCRPADDPGRATHVASALGEASRAPLEIAEAAAEVAVLAAAVTGASAPAVRGDALCGAVLAEAAAAAAAALVEINLEARGDDPLLRRARDARERAREARARAAAIG